MSVSIMLEMNDASWHKKNVGDDMVRLKEGFSGKFVEKMGWKNTKKKQYQHLLDAVKKGKYLTKSDINTR